MGPQKRTELSQGGRVRQRAELSTRIFWHGNQDADGYQRDRCCQREDLRHERTRHGHPPDQHCRSRTPIGPASSGRGALNFNLAPRYRIRGDARVSVSLARVVIFV